MGAIARSCSVGRDLGPRLGRPKAVCLSHWKIYSVSVACSPDPCQRFLCRSTHFLNWKWNGITASPPIGLDSVTQSRACLSCWLPFQKPNITSPFPDHKNSSQTAVHGDGDQWVQNLWPTLPTAKNSRPLVSTDWEFCSSCCWDFIGSSFHIFVLDFVWFWKVSGVAVSFFFYVKSPHKAGRFSHSGLRLERYSPLQVYHSSTKRELDISAQHCFLSAQGRG